MRTTTVGVLWLSLIATSAAAQDLDPRAYAKVPTGLTIAIAGLSFSSGGVLTDPTLSVQNVSAKVTTPSLGVAQSFNLFGKTAQGLVALPYSWAHVSGEVGEQARSIDRSGLSDMRLRLSVLVAGAPAMTPQQFAKSPRRPVVGASLTVGAPTGQYTSQRLVNLGTNRWSVKPEVALSYPLGPKWLVDAYAGVWFFGTNHDYYPANAVRTQTSITALQTHISYSLSLRAWAAFDATWYGGGKVRVNDVPGGVRASNTRFGGTLVFPLTNRQALKVAASAGAITRSGADFTTLSIGWQAGWLTRRSRPKQ